MVTPLHRAALALLLAAASLAGAAPAAAQQVPQSAEEMRLTFAPVVKRAAPAVVNVYATEAPRRDASPFADDPFFRRFFEGFDGFALPRERARSSLGSGVIVEAGGVVVTNHHVVANADSVKVALADGREYPAEILLSDERTDLAVLRIRDGEDAFATLEFADSDALEVGDLVLAIGNPFGVGQTVTSGIVSAVARTEVGISDLNFFIQTDAAINPGNSGGALVDLRGQLVGINTAIFSRSGGSLGIGFAIPSNMVRMVVAQALAGGTEVARPWLGASLQAVTADIARTLGLDRPRGALVTDVEPDSPAARAGLRVGDLIVAAGVREVSNPAELDYRLTIAGIGGEVLLQVQRDGASLALPLRLEAPPEGGDLYRLEGRSPLAGATVADLSPALAERLRLRRRGAGVAIVDVDPRSPAARLGLMPGDVVVAAQGERVARAGRLKEITAQPSRLWRLTIDRGGRISNLVIGG